MKYFLKWYSQARVMQAIDRLMPIIEGRAKLLNYLRQKPAVAFFKLLRLRNPEIYLPKLKRLCIFEKEVSNKKAKFSERAFQKRKWFSAKDFIKNCFIGNLVILYKRLKFSFRM